MPHLQPVNHVNACCCVWCLICFFKPASLQMKRNIAYVVAEFGGNTDDQLAFGETSFFI